MCYTVTCHQGAAHICRWVLMASIFIRLCFDFCWTQRWSIRLRTELFFNMWLPQRRTCAGSPALASNCGGEQRPREKRRPTHQHHICTAVNHVGLIPNQQAACWPAMLSVIFLTCICISTPSKPPSVINDTSVKENKKVLLWVLFLTLVFDRFFFSSFRIYSII